MLVDGGMGEERNLGIHMEGWTGGDEKGKKGGGETKAAQESEAKFTDAAERSG